MRLLPSITDVPKSAVINNIPTLYRNSAALPPEVARTILTRPFFLSSNIEVTMCSIKNKTNSSETCDWKKSTMPLLSPAFGSVPMSASYLSTDFDVTSDAKPCWKSFIPVRALPCFIVLLRNSGYSTIYSSRSSPVSVISLLGLAPNMNIPIF